MAGTLYLIPTLLGEGSPAEALPLHTIQILKKLKIFIVEELRSARRFLSKAGIETPIDELTFYVLNEHSQPKDIVHFLDKITEDAIGLISEAGAPGVADPGADIVKLAHSKGIKVVPLVGPSSILLAIMASGLNGQNFAFNGYLPVKKPEKTNKIKFYEKRALTDGQTQIFIEAPYRNMQLLEDFLSTCSPSTMLGIAVDINMETEFISTRSIENWKKQLPEIHKRPAIFMIGR